MAPEPALLPSLSGIWNMSSAAWPLLACRVTVPARFQKLFFKRSPVEPSTKYKETTEWEKISANNTSEKGLISIF